MHESSQHRMGLSRGPLAALPWLLLLPVAILCWPFVGAPLRDDPFPHLAGSAWVLIGSLPAALLLAFIPVRPARRAREIGLLFLLWVFLAFLILFHPGPDSLEAKRALTLVSTWPVLFLGGARLDTRGRRSFGRGLVLVSIAATSVALLPLLDPSGDGSRDLVGMFGNTGPLSQVALPGAVIGAWYVATRRGLFLGLGTLAVALFLAHAGLAPVLAGGLVFTLVLVASSLTSPWAKGRAQVRRRLGMLGAVAIFSLVALQAERKSETEPDRAPEALAVENVGQVDHEGTGGNFGGIEVRARVWRSTLRILRDHPLLGLGPGQFQALYPPYRDAREIELSRGGVCATGNTEADHAHNDLLQGFSELGLVGGFVWAAFLFFALRASLIALGELDFPTIGLGAGALAMLLASMLHSPLWFHPPASALAMVLFGGVLGRTRERDGPCGGRPVALAALYILLAGLVIGFPLIRHGRSLARFVAAVRAREEHVAAAEPAQLVAKALPRTPDSAPLRFLAARASTDPAPWKAALELRPHSVEAWTALGLARIRAGDLAGARASWETALALSPTLPTLLRNITQLAYRQGDLASARRTLLTLESNGCTDATWSSGLGSELVLTGRIRDGAHLLFPPDGSLPAPEVLNEDAGSDTNLGRAHRVLAHLLWARQQVAAGEFATSVRSYRQALAPTKAAVPGGAPSIRAEYAAALFLAGKTEEAEREVRSLALEEDTRASLPSWVSEAIPSLAAR